MIGNKPKAWSKADIGTLCNLVNGRAFKSTEWSETGLPIIRIQNLNNSVAKYNYFDGELSEKHRIENGDLLFAWSGTPGTSFGAHVWRGEMAALNQHIFKIEFERSLIEKRFLLYAINQTLDVLISGAHGGVGLRHVTKGKFEAAEISFPPLAEQKVIADKLDTLLAQVDNTKARLQRIPKILKRFRQSVLAAAVSGRLTEEWRENKAHILEPSTKELEEYWKDVYNATGKKLPRDKGARLGEKNNVPNGWVDTSIGAVFDVFVGSTPSRSVKSYWGGNVCWVSSSEVAFCYIKSTKEMITKSGLSSASTSIHPPGTVMLAMIGQGKTRGQVAILGVDACHNQNTAALRVPEGFVVSEYLYYYLTQQYEETRRIGGGNNQKALNKKVIQAMRFPMPSYEEQTEIVRRVDQLFAYADTVERQVNSALERVNQLTQSILGKAFRGELTAQWRADNPELISGENSAEALLERIQEACAAQAPKKRTRKKATA